MQRYYTRNPIVFGRFKVVTTWESDGGGLFFNPEAIVMDGDTEVQRFPFSELKRAEDLAITLYLDSNKRKDDLIDLPS